MLLSDLVSDRSLFWDAAPDTIDPEAHAEYVIARVLSLGLLPQVKGLVRCYGAERLRAFFRDGGLYRVDAQTAAFWLLVLGLRREECERRSWRPASPRFWTA